MKEEREKRRRACATAAAAAVAAVLCVWRLPRALGLGAESTAAAAHAVSVALAAGLYLLIKRALGCRDRGINRTGYGLGALFAVITAVGESLQAAGELETTLSAALDWLLTAVPLTMAYGAVIVLALRRVDAIAGRPAREGAEPRWRRVLGSGPAAFLMMIA